MSYINPSPEQLTALAAQADREGPVVMINLLRYREQAEYPEGAPFPPCTGREAYARYSEVALQKVSEAGGRPIWLGQVQLNVIAPDAEVWDDAVLVEYPSRRSFLEMVAKPDYQASSVHRTAALADSRLILTQGQALPGMTE